MSEEMQDVPEAATGPEAPPQEPAVIDLHDVADAHSATPLGSPAGGCGCPEQDGKTYHQQGTCADPVVAALGWYADGHPKTPLGSPAATAPPGTLVREASADRLVDHLVDCRDAGAAIVVDGNGDGVVATLIAAGWTYGGTEHVEGKRVRYLTPPVIAREVADGE